MALAAGLVAIIAWSYLIKADAQTPKAIALLGTADVHALAISPTDPSVVFFGHHNGIMRSDDGGNTWRPLVAKQNFDAMGLAAIPGSPGVVYAAGHLLLFRTDNGGASWQPVKHDLPYDDIHGFAVDPADTKTLYAFVVGYGLFKSQDSGTSWTRISTALPGSVMALAVAVDDPRALYAGTMGGGLLRSNDGGVTWRSASQGIDSSMVMSLAVTPSVPGLVYAGTDKGLYRSVDGGASWSPTGFTRPAFAVAVGPSNPRLILVVDSDTKVYRSQDGGATWGGG